MPPRCEPGDQFHAAIDFIDIIESEPHGDGVMRGHGPIIRVLVPTDRRSAAGRFNEKVARPTVEVGAEHAGHEIVDFGVHTNVKEVRAGLVPFADVFSVFAGFEQGEQVRQFGVDLGHLGRGENRRQAEEVAVVSVECLLVVAELIGRIGGSHRRRGISPKIRDRRRPRQTERQ